MYVAYVTRNASFVYNKTFIINFVYIVVLVQMPELD